MSTCSSSCSKKKYAYEIGAWALYGCVFFFFQAEDGIRDLIVTGVQTCALPICLTFDCGDHEEIFEAGDAFYIEAGHVPTSSEPGTEYLQFSPTEQLQIVSDTMMRNMQEMQPGDTTT